MISNNTVFNSLDRSTSSTCKVIYPKNIEDLKNINNKHDIICQGAGLSYTAASFDSNSLVIKMDNFNKIGEVNYKESYIEVESGVKLLKLYNFLIVNGYRIRSLPGYYNISIGGLIAGNTHGKNHYKNGCFYNSVISLNLFHPQKGIINCSKENNVELFNLTVGGFGLTGIILNAKIKLASLSKVSAISKTIYMSNLNDTISSLYKLKDESETIISWNNLSGSSKEFGEGALMYSTPSSIDNNALIQNPKLLNPHKEIYNLKLFNRVTIPIINKLFLYHILYTPKIKQEPYYLSLFPWHNKLYYFKGYGKNGFIQHQVLIPHKNVEEYFLEFKYHWKQNYTPIFFTLFKLFKGGKKYLNFDGEGFSFAIDIINDRVGISFLNSLDQINIKYGCITNILKDSRLSKSIVQKQFGDEYFSFRDALINYDAKLTFKSNLSKRIGITK
tara:strand:+ start:528 stop:1859 length:1332 start_codon:yes stop_codon:yes gene_type:complete